MGCVFNCFRVIPEYSPSLQWAPTSRIGRTAGQVVRGSQSELGEMLPVLPERLPHLWVLKKENEARSPPQELTV